MTVISHHENVANEECDIMIYLVKGVRTISVKPDSIVCFLNMLIATFICLLICCLFITSSKSENKDNLKFSASSITLEINFTDGVQTCEYSLQTVILVETYLYKTHFDLQKKHFVFFRIMILNAVSFRFVFRLNL